MIYIIIRYIFNNIHNQKERKAPHNATQVFILPSFLSKFVKS